jgi:hypothetical protein
MSRFCLRNLSVLLALSALTCRDALEARTQDKSLLGGVASNQVRPTEVFAKVPLYFEANQGQTDAQVKFLSRGAGHILFLTPSKAVLVLTRREPAHTESGKTEGRSSGTVLNMSFVGANRQLQISGRDEFSGKVSYFIGNDPSKWRTNISTYGRVLYRELYPGIDLVYRGREGQLEYDYIVHPGADLRKIVLGFSGTERVELDAQGDLVLHADSGVIRQRKPTIYQEIDGVRQKVSGGYVLKGARRVGFRVAAHDQSRPLVIDPVLFYSTYLGGSGDDSGQSIAVDGAGNAYVTGFTNSADFPKGPGAFQTSGGISPFPQPIYDTFVTKLNPAGSAPLVYSTYLGGSSDDYGRGITVDGLGNAYVTGQTASTNFPTTLGAFQTTTGGSTDAFVTKLNSSGSALVYSTYLGGSCSDSAWGIALDGFGNAYVTGQTSSTNFPTTLGAAFPITLGAGCSFKGMTFDAFASKLNPTGSALVYSTFLGGSSDDFGLAIAVDSQGSAYVTGSTISANFPTTLGAFQTTFGGSSDAFVTKLNPAGSAPLVYSTYLGGNGSESANGIGVDSSGNAYVAGSTSSTNFPTTLGAFQTTSGGFIDAFVTKLNPTGSAPVVYSTYLGGSGSDYGRGIAVSSAGNAYVTGGTSSTNFPTTPGAFQTTFGGFSDVFVTKLNSAGSAPLVYSTYLGGRGVESGIGIAVDTFDNAYVTGQTDSTNFPTPPGAFPTTFGGFSDAFVAKIAEVNVEECPPSGQGDCEQGEGGGEVDDDEKDPEDGHKGQFSFMVRRPSTTRKISGTVQYLSRANGTQMQSAAVTSLVITGNAATLAGTCTNNGVPCTFVANVTDGGPIGTGESFTLSISDGPVRGGALRGGKILLRPR